MSYEEIKKYIEDNHITRRSVLESSNPEVYKFFCRLTLEEKDLLLPYKGKYNNFNTIGDFKEFIKKNDVKTRGELDDNYSRVYKLFRNLTPEEKDLILPRKETTKYHLKTYSDFEKFIKDNNVVSKSYFYRDFPRAYLLFNELLSDEERDTLLPPVFSSGELSLINLFESCKFEFTTQKTFEDLKSRNDKKLRYDFFVQNKVLVEYQGHQHFDKDNMLYDPDSILRDKQKFEYAQENNIPLLYFTNEVSLYKKFGYFTDVITDSDILIEKIKEIKISLTN